MSNENTPICFIINPAAKRHHSLKNIKWLRRKVSKSWKTYEIIIAQQHDSLPDLAREKSKDFDIIVACGGDGTISQIANGLAETDTVLGVLPLGSGNDFVKSIGLDKSLSRSLEILRRNHISEIDLIRYEGDAEGWCINTIGIGLDGWANYYAHQIIWLKGFTAYLVGALKAILNFRGAEMEIIFSTILKKENFLMITACNGKWEGGNFLLAPDADLQDGYLDLLSIKNSSVYRLIVYLLRFRWGPAPWMKGVEYNRTKSIKISSSMPLAVHRDGEHLGTNIRRLKLTVEKNSLKIIVPKNY